MQGRWEDNIIALILLHFQTEENKNGCGVQLHRALCILKGSVALGVDKDEVEIKTNRNITRTSKAMGFIKQVCVRKSSKAGVTLLPTRGLFTVRRRVDIQGLQFKVFYGEMQSLSHQGCHVLGNESKIISVNAKHQRTTSQATEVTSARFNHRKEKWRPSSR